MPTAPVPVPSPVQYIPLKTSLLSGTAHWHSFLEISHTPPINHSQSITSFPNLIHLQYSKESEPDTLASYTASSLPHTLFIPPYTHLPQHQLLTCLHLTELKHAQPSLLLCLALSLKPPWVISCLTVIVSRFFPHCSAPDSDFNYPPL